MAEVSREVCQHSQLSLSVCVCVRERYELAGVNRGEAVHQVNSYRMN